MEKYRILPSGYNHLEDFEPEEKIGIFLADSLIKNVKDIQRYIDLTHKLEVMKATDPIKFLGENEALGFEDIRAGLAITKKNAAIADLENLIKEEGFNNG